MRFTIENNKIEEGFIDSQKGIFKNTGNHNTYPIRGIRTYTRWGRPHKSSEG